MKVERSVRNRKALVLLFAFARVADDRQEADRELAQLVRTVGRVGIEEQGIAGAHDVGLVAVAVADLALQHVQEFDAGMLEDREDVRLLRERDEIGLDGDVLAERVAQELILVAGAGAAALDREALPGRHEGGVALLLIATEEGGDR